MISVFDALEAAQIPHAVLHSHDFGSRIKPSKDVDILVPKEYIQALVPKALAAGGLNVVQDLHRSGDAHAHQFVVTDGLDSAGLPLRLDFITDYGPGGQILYSSNELLESRQWRGQLWALSTELEFICYLVKRVLEADLNDVREHRLAVLYENDPVGCRGEIERWWGSKNARSLINAAESGDWSQIRRHAQPIRSNLRRRLTLRNPLGMPSHWLREAKRYVTRCLRPTGLQITFVGPDGVGKTTAIQEVTAALKAAFWRIHVAHFPPRLFERHSEKLAASGPHDARPWPLSLSIFKLAAMSTVLAAYHSFWVRPQLLRSTLFVFDRDFADLVVDPKRFRYGGPKWLAELAWRLAPKADLVILLDAPAETIQSRQIQVPLEETARQVQVYRDLVEKLPNGVIIDASGSPESVVSNVRRAILEHLTERTARRLGLEERQ